MKTAATRSTERPLAALLAAALLALGLASPACAGEVQWLDRIAVTVDDDVVMESDVERRLRDVRDQIAARNAAMPPDDVLRRQVLERLVVESVQLQLGRRLGIRIDDDSVTAAITGIDDDSVTAAITGIARQNGMALREFVERLAAEGIDYAAFREQVRDDMVMNRVRQRRVGERVRVTDKDVEEFLQSAAGRDMFAGSYHLAHILVAVPETARVEEVQAAQQEVTQLLADARAGADFSDLAVRHSDAANALEGGDLGWRTAAQLPMLFAGVATTLKPGEIAGPLRSASGFHLVKLIERKGDAERVVQQAKVRHVLVKPSAIRSGAEARELAQQVHDRALSGEDFAALAKQHSDDPGSALSGGDLGWVSPGQMVEEFDAAIAATATGQTSPVFETQYGWHFLQVLERRDQDTSEEYRRLQARNAVWKRKFDAELDTWLRELRNEAWVEFKDPPATPAAASAP